MLTPEQFRAFHKALINAYTPQELQRMFRFRLGKNILDYTTLTQDQQQIVFDLISAAERGGWTEQFILAAREANLGNPLLQVFAQSFGLVPQMAIAAAAYTEAAGAYPSNAQLERIVREANYFLDINTWRERLGTIEGQVCAVEIGGQHSGTGFLVGPDVVLTNYHVVEEAINGQVPPSQISLRFDYKRLTGGKVLNPGVTYSLAAGDEWLIDHSPYSSLDMGNAFDPEGPGPDELDYALLRAAVPVGDLPVGGDKGDPLAPTRSWITASTHAHDFTARPALYIVQHP